MCSPARFATYFWYLVEPFEALMPLLFDVQMHSAMRRAHIVLVMFRLARRFWRRCDPKR